MKLLFFLVVFLSAPVMAADGVDVALITSVEGEVRHSGGLNDSLRTFERLRVGERVELRRDGRVQILFFSANREEVWIGSGSIELLDSEAIRISGEVRSESKALAPWLVKQLAKTPLPDGGLAKIATGRTRSIPSGTTLESVERAYEVLRREAATTDRKPELFLLSGYFELQEFDRVEGVLKSLSVKAPNDLEVKVLRQLYARAIANARSQAKRSAE